MPGTPRQAHTCFPSPQLSRCDAGGRGSLGLTSGSGRADGLVPPPPWPQVSVAVRPPWWPGVPVRGGAWARLRVNSGRAAWPRVCPSHRGSRGLVCAWAAASLQSRPSGKTLPRAFLPLKRPRETVGCRGFRLSRGALRQMARTKRTHTPAHYPAPCTLNRPRFPPSGVLHAVNVYH